MGRKKQHKDRMHRLVGEPGPGARVVGYVRYSSDRQSSATIETQKRKIEQLAAEKGWLLVGWYEEPAHSAKYEEIERRPVFAQLLADAGALFEVVLCYSTSHWARSNVVTGLPLSHLRRKGVWWATTSQLFTIDLILELGSSMIHVLTAQADQDYVVQLSKATIDGLENRGQEGFHNGKVPFSYRRPAHPIPPEDAPASWKPPRLPARIDPVTFPALVRLDELVAAGWSDAAIADELASQDVTSKTPRFGVRPLTKDTIASIRRTWFPREFTPGSGKGTIETPSGELVEGKHPAAWRYALWHRMIEAKRGQYHRPTREAQRRAHEFSRIIVCAACRRPLRAGGRWSRRRGSGRRGVRVVQAGENLGGEGADGGVRILQAGLQGADEGGKRRGSGPAPRRPQVLDRGQPQRCVGALQALEEGSEEGREHLC
jgi:DNA invertase Pin-like site-specific DNA recombinase